MIKKTKGSLKWIRKEDNLENIGLHLIVEFWGGKKIEDPKKFEEILVGAAKAARATVLKVNTHKFLPHGVTGVVLLSESHITFHTWPEFEYLALDIFTCGKKCNPYKALEYFKEKIKPKNVQVMEIKRGLI